MSLMTQELQDHMSLSTSFNKEHISQSFVFVQCYVITITCLFSFSYCQAIVICFVCRFTAFGYPFWPFLHIINLNKWLVNVCKHLLIFQTVAIWIKLYILVAMSKDEAKMKIRKDVWKKPSFLFPFIHRYNYWHLSL